MKKILFGITSLTLGGAERVLVDLANKLAQQYDVTIFTIYAKGEFENQLSNRVKLKSMYNVAYNDLTYIQKHFSTPLRLLLLKRNIYKLYVQENYDVEIAFLEGPITRLFSVHNSRARKIVWVHNDISRVFGKGIKSTIKKMIDRRIYSKYKDIIFVSNDNLEKFNKVYPNIKSNKQVIYNYIDKAIILKRSEEKANLEMNDNEMNFVTVTRLVEQKGLDRLIRVHSKLIKEGLYHKFYVIGDGPLKDKLSELINQEKVESTFKLMGKQSNPYVYMKKASYFCLLSYFEGYGMVLEEAKMLGKPIIITDTASREALKDYKKSRILDNTEEGIYEGLKKVIQENDSFVDFSQNTNYDNNQILIDVIDLIEQR